MLKFLEKMGNKRPIHIITRSPNQYPNSETNAKFESMEKYGGSVVIFDDTFGARNSFQTEQFFTRGILEGLDVFYFSQSYFGLPRQNVRDNSDIKILFTQTLSDAQSVNTDIGAYDVKYDEFQKKISWILEWEVQLSMYWYSSK